VVAATLQVARPAARRCRLFDGVRCRRLKSIFRVFLEIKLFVNTLLFIVQRDLNKIQIQPVKKINFY
jgi:hypothetical protein